MDDLIYTESPAELLLSDIENAVDRIGLPNLLNGLHIGVFKESDVVKLCEFLSQTIAKMKREGERLTEYSAVFLKTFATDDNGYYDSWLTMSKKIKRTVSATLKVMSKFHVRQSRRILRMRMLYCKPELKPYETSSITRETATVDMYGLTSYPECVSRLYDLMMEFRTVWKETYHTCSVTIRKEREIRKVPEFVLGTFQEFREKCMKKYRHVFDVLNHADITYSDSLKNERLTCGSDEEFAVKGYHSYQRSDVERMVLKEADEMGMLYGISAMEGYLFGKDVERVMKVKYVIEHFDELLEGSDANRKKLPARCVAWFMGWCKISGEKTEKDFVKYFMERYRQTGSHGVVTYKAVNAAKNDSLKSGSDKERKTFITRIGVMLAHLSNRTA